jgi:hypothetical protein
MSMLSGSVLGPSGDGPRKRHPVATGAIVVLMMVVLFGATFGAVRLLRGSSTPEANGPTAAPCVTTTVQPGLVLPKPATVTVNVYNATDRAGLAASTAAELKSRGFGIGKIANDPLGKSLTNVAEVRYGPAGKANAQLLVYYVPGATLVLDKRTDTTVDLVLGTKFKAIPAQSTVDAALAAPVPVASGDGCPSPSATPKPSKSPKASKSPKPSKN